MTSTWRAFGPIRTEWERSALSTRWGYLPSSSRQTSDGALMPDRGRRSAEYLDRFPELSGADSRVLSLVYEEFCLCEERDGCADVDSFCDRYPDWKSSLESQLHYHRLISQAAGATDALPPIPEGGRAVRGV